VLLFDALTLGDVVVDALVDADALVDLLIVAVRLVFDDNDGLNDIDAVGLLGDGEELTDGFEVGDAVELIDVFDDALSDALLLGVAVDALELEAVGD